MSILLDSSLLGRFANTADRDHALAVQAVSRLELAGERILLTPQILIEFRNFATRPTAQNGLGMTAQQADSESIKYEAAYPLLADTPDIYPAWKQIVQSLGVTGKQVHDARLIAVCQVHQVTHLLSFNVGHFARLAAGATPPVAVIDPRTV